MDANRIGMRTMFWLHMLGVVWIPTLIALTTYGLMHPFALWINIPIGIFNLLWTRHFYFHYKNKYQQRVVEAI